jgi:hypothetical protein
MFLFPLTPFQLLEQPASVLRLNREEHVRKVRVRKRRALVGLERRIHSIAIQTADRRLDDRGHGIFAVWDQTRSRSVNVQIDDHD